MSIQSLLYVNMAAFATVVTLLEMLLVTLLPQESFKQLHPLRFSTLGHLPGPLLTNVVKWLTTQNQRFLFNLVE